MKIASQPISHFSIPQEIKTKTSKTLCDGLLRPHSQALQFIYVFIQPSSFTTCETFAFKIFYTFLLLSRQLVTGCIATQRICTPTWSHTDSSESVSKYRNENNKMFVYEKSISRISRWRKFENPYTRIKVKWSRYRPGVAQRVGRGIALLFHDRGTRRGWVVSSTPRPHFTPGKDPVPILQEAGWAPGPVWTVGKSRPHRDSIPDRPARSSVSIPTELPGPQNP